MRLRHSQPNSNIYFKCHSESRLLKEYLSKSSLCQASNALAPNVNGILSVPSEHSFRQCLSTSKKVLYSPFCGYQCFSWPTLANPFLSMFLLDWTWTRFGLSHFQCSSWARLGLEKAQFWANPFFPMFLLGWTWARFGLRHFLQCFSWARLGLDKA